MNVRLRITMGKRLPAHFRANAVAYIALFFALAGTSVAATGRLLPRNSVGSDQVVNGSLEKVDLSPDAVTSLKGKQGQRGTPGIQGPQGATGAQGPAGTAGQAGAIGPQGPPGPQGASGLPGAPGSSGQTGATGPQGATGPAGPARTPLVWSGAAAQPNVASNVFPTIGPFTLSAWCSNIVGEELLLSVHVTSQEPGRIQYDGTLYDGDVPFAASSPLFAGGALLATGADLSVHDIFAFQGHYGRLVLHAVLATNSGHVLDVSLHGIADWRNFNTSGTCAIDGSADYAP